MKHDYILANMLKWQMDHPNAVWTVFCWYMGRNLQI